MAHSGDSIRGCPRVPTKTLTQAEYYAKFGTKKKLALEAAMDVRKFEIDLYWKRASYFWTFIAAGLGALGVVLASVIEPVRTDLAVLLSCLGVVFSVGWLAANKGSKHWQENWENHVDLLEDDEVGPLYKVVLTRPVPTNLREWVRHVLTGPSQLSVSKINQLISYYVTVLWIGLLVYCTPIDYQATFNWYYVGAIVLTAMTCVSFFTVGKTHTEDYWHIATIRGVEVRKPDSIDHGRRKEKRNRRKEDALER
jgi:hypothetical protein